MLACIVPANRVTQVPQLQARLVLDDVAWNIVARHPACAHVAVLSNICFISVG